MHPRVDVYASDLNSELLPLFLKVRTLVLNSSNGIVESFKYGVPFYTYQGYLFYLGMYKKRKLVLAFCNGVYLSDEAGVLEADAGQSQLKHWHLDHKKPLNEELLRVYIQEALMVNEQLAEKKKIEKR
jgi:hypothetical protein